jgi:uncharacterized protein (DUF433 family)
MPAGTLSETTPITVDPNVMSGVPVFRGTRVPAQTLFDYIADGCTLDEFLDNFPTVNRADALQVLEEAAERVSVAAFQ